MSTSAPAGSAAYFEEICDFPLLTPEDEARLSEEIAKGSTEARYELIRANLRLVVKIAHDFKGRGVPLLDLISEGNIGLLRAVDRFDPAKGARFSSYAAWWIRQAIRRALANQGRTIRVPRHSLSNARRVNVTRNQLQQELGREPSVQEIANKLGISEKAVLTVQCANMQSISLQAALQEDGERSIGELVADESIVSPEKILEHHDTQEWLMRVIECLGHREKTVLKLRFGLGDTPRKTLEETSRHVGCTRERARQLQWEALGKLKVLYKQETLPEENNSHNNHQQKTSNKEK